MIIPINHSPSNSPDGAHFPPQLAKLGTDELILLELQGAFQVEGSPAGQLAARLQMQNEKPTLRIGHHLLEGKVVNLSKPLAVLAKKSPRKSEAAKDSRATSTSQDDDMTTEVSYDVVALVKRKLLFSKRPMPIVGQASTVA